MASIVQTEIVESFESSSRPGTYYEVRRNTDSDRHVYLSCNCRAWTTSTKNRGKQAWERFCKHTQAAERGVPAGRRTAAAGRRPRRDNTESGRFDALEL